MRRNSEESDAIYVMQSSIEGQGVFAARDIAAGEKIIKYTGEKIHSKIGDMRAERQLKRGHLYIFKLNEKYDIDGLKGGDARLINHSCDPNSESINYDDEEIWILAMKDIKQDEEITFDYDLTGNKEIKCLCGKGNCRGDI